MTDDNFSQYVVPQESDEYSIADIAPTILRFLEKKGCFDYGKIEAGVLGGETKFWSLYDIQGLDHYHGQSLEEVIENRLTNDLESYERIIVILVDGMSFQSITGAGKLFSEKVKFEFIPIFTSFPSMTTVATTSLLTGSFPIAHGVVADSFFDFEENRVIKVKPYLTSNAQETLPKVIPLTDYLLLSGFWDKQCTMEIITLGKENEKLSDREFIDFFFGHEFDIGGKFVKAKDNFAVYQEAKKFIVMNSSLKFYFLFVRFSIDPFAHLYGSSSQEARKEMEKIFGYLVDLNRELTNLKQKSLIFLLTDHGHRDLNEGLVPFSSLKNYLGKDYKYTATNQTLLSLYHDDLHIDHPDYNFAKMIRLRKQNSDFYYFNQSDEKWIVLNKKLEDIEPIILPSDKYGVDNKVGDLVINAENFYFSFHDLAHYSGSNFSKFKSSHGGLSTEETYCPCMFWESI
jgi:hypothetical protein